MGCCSSPSPPPAPDYAGAAREQGAANLDAARAQGRINNPNYYGPTGSQVVSWDGDTPSIRQTLSPEQQALYDQQVQNQRGLGDLASQGIGSLGGLIGTGLDLSGAPQAGTALDPNSIRGGTPLDPNSLPAMRDAWRGASGLPAAPQSAEATRQRVINAVLQRSNAAIDRGQDQTQSDLIARGIRPGTRAYREEMDAIGRQRNDAMSQAEATADSAVNNAFQQDLTRRGQAYGEQTNDANMGFDQQARIIQALMGQQGQSFAQSGQLAQLLQSIQGQGFDQSNRGRQQYLQEMLAERQTPLNEITALMSGSQVSNPFAIGGYNGNTQVAPAPIFGAAQATDAANMNRYNIASGNSNNAMNGLFGLGAAGLGAAGAAGGLASFF